MTENEIAAIIVDISFKVHSSLGPGLFESVYEAVIAYELDQCGLRVDRQKPIPVTWNGVRLDQGFRADLIVDEKVIVEIKSVEAISPVHFKQVLTYLRLTGLKLGILVNFNESLIKNGLHRIVNNL